MRNTNKVKIIPLGGLHEIGKNLTVIEYRDDIIIVDCGMTFPEDEMLGIDVVIPDVTYLENNKDKIRGLVLTHGHEDHIGAIPYVLRKLDLDIYGTALTIGLLENKLKEHRLSRDKLHVVSAGNVVKLGKMEVEWINVNHSIPDACALAIKTPLGYVYHSGDFKVDFTPISGKPIDLTRIAEIGEKGVLAMIGESTNVLRPGYTMSESKVGETFNRLFQNLSENRIIIATFASNVHRVQQIINSAEKYGRKVVLSGRSMINVTETAKKLGQFRVKKDTFVDIKDMYKYDDSEIVLITTGSQGEPMSALTRIAYGEHRKIELTPNDAIILSATPIPGNENAVTKVINRLLERGAKVIYETLSEIHVSGHACQEELKLMQALVKPKFFIPVHGEYRHLKQHAELAVDVGLSEKNFMIAENGDVGNIVLRDRKHLSEDGLIIVVITITKEGKVVSGPDIISRGFVYVRESEDLIEDAKNVVRKILKEESNENLKDWNGLKSDIRDNLRSYILKNTKRNPMILPIIMEV